MTERARYLVLDKSYIDHSIREEGQELEYDGLPGPNLKPLNEAAERQVKEYEKAEAARKAKLEADFGGSKADAFEEALKKAVAANNGPNAKAIAEGIATALATMFPQGMNKPPVVS